MCLMYMSWEAQQKRGKKANIFSAAKQGLGAWKRYCSPAEGRTKKSGRPVLSRRNILNTLLDVYPYSITLEQLSSVLWKLG